MGSAAISFSGFNNVDFNVVLNALMQQASQPLTTLQSRQTALQSQVTTYGSLGAKINTLQDAADDLSDLSALASFKATSSDSTSLGASATAGASAGQYEVVVNDVARAQVTVSTSSSPDADSTIVTSGGSLTIGGVSVAIAGNTTLQGLASAINNTANIGVHATVVRTSASSYRLALTSSASGAANAFTVVNNLTGGGGVAFADADNDNISGDSSTDNAVNASDAALLVNNIPITSSSNTFTDVIPGVTLTAFKKDPSATILVDVTSDSTNLTTTLQKFVTAYNDIAKFASDQRAAAIRGDGASIGHDPLLRQLGSSLRSQLLGAHGSSTLTRLAEIGVEFTKTGTLQLNQTKFTAALDEDETGVRNLIGGVDGAFQAVGAQLTSYAAADGFINTVKDRLTAQVKSMDDQIAKMQQRLALQRESLQRGFIEADLAMSRLKDQASSLSSIGSNLSSF